MKQINDETASRLIGLMDEFRRCLDKGGIVLDPDLVDERIKEIDAHIAELENADPVPDLELLKDPTAVLTMILRGTIAKPAGFERVDLNSQPDNYHIESDPATGKPRAVEGEAVDYTAHPDYGLCDCCPDQCTPSWSRPCSECKHIGAGEASYWRPEEATA